MAATLRIISGKVGADGQTTGAEVHRVLQLLRRAGFLPAGASLTTWSPAATQAVKDFHARAGFAERAGFDPDEKYDGILELCKRAGVVVPLKFGASGASAFMAFWSELVARKVPYIWSAVGNGKDRVAYGLDGYPQYIVFTLGGAANYFDPDPTQPGIGLNCTSFTNLGLAVWRMGNAHARPYDASQDAGGFNPLSQRYGLGALRAPASPLDPWVDGLLQPMFAPGLATPSPLLPSAPRGPVAATPLSRAAQVIDTYFTDSESALRQTQAGRLYHVMWCYTQQQTTAKGTRIEAGFGHHDTLLYNGDIYEINVGEPCLRCQPLATRMNWGKAKKEAIRIFGPM